MVGTTTNAEAGTWAATCVVVVDPFDIRCAVVVALRHNNAPEAVVDHALCRTVQVTAHEEEQVLVLQRCQRTPSQPMRAMDCLLASQRSRSCLQAWELAGVQKRQVAQDRYSHMLEEVVDWRREEAHMELIQEHPRAFDWDTAQDLVLLPSSLLLPCDRRVKFADVASEEVSPMEWKRGSPQDLV